MKAINLSGDEHVLRIKSSLLSLRQGLLAVQFRATKVYRQALARRFTVCYFAFLNYLVARLQVYEKPHEQCGMEDIIQRCRRSNILNPGDERMIIKMSMLYAALSYYDEGFDVASDELLADIPEMANFLERFISLHGVVPLRRAILQPWVN